MNYYPILNIAIKIIRILGNNIIQIYDRELNHLLTKEFLKKIDLKLHFIAQNIIKKYYPKHIIKKFYKNIFNKKNIKKPTWIIKNIHGRKNFKKQIPYFCVSITVLIKKKIVVSVIYDPLRNELFTSIRNKGTKLNNLKIKKKNFFSLKNCFYIIKNNNFSNKNFIFYKKMLKIFKKKKNYERKFGSNTLEMMYFLKGRIDYIIDFNFKFSNFPIEIFHFKESNVVIKDIYGGNNYINNIAIITRNKKFLKILL